MGSVEVWDPTIQSVVEYKCVIATKKILPGTEFIVKYYMDGADMREREKMCKVGRRTDKENVVRLRAIDSAAPKHFESSVAKLPDKRKRTTSEAMDVEVEGGEPIKIQRKSKRMSTRSVQATTVSIEGNPLGEGKRSIPEDHTRKKNNTVIQLV